MRLHQILRTTAAAFLALAASCASTTVTERGADSGFLSHYDRLNREGEGDAEFWARSDFDLDDFDWLYIPEVEIWLSAEERGRVSDESARMLADFYREQAIDKLTKQGWTIVSNPGRRTVILRLALTELSSPNRIGSVLTSIPIMTTGAIKLTAKVGDLHFLVGMATTELQIIEASSGKLLAEAVTRRVGTHSLLNMGSTWADVEDAIEVWTDNLADGLSKLKQR